MFRQKKSVKSMVATAVFFATMMIGTGVIFASDGTAGPSGFLKYLPPVIGVVFLIAAVAFIIKLQKDKKKNEDN